MAVGANIPAELIHVNSLSHAASKVPQQRPPRRALVRAFSLSTFFVQQSEPIVVPHQPCPCNTLPDRYSMTAARGHLFASIPVEILSQKLTLFNHHFGIIARALDRHYHHGARSVRF